MSDNRNDKKRRPLKNLPPERFQPKVILIWLAVSAAIAALYFLSSSKVASPASLKIQEVVDLAEKGLVAKGEIRPDISGGSNQAIVTGELKEATLDGGNGIKTKAFFTSGRLIDANMDKLQKSAVFIERPATTVLSNLAQSIIPFVLIIGLIYFLFMRQIRSAGRGALSFGKSRAKLLTRDRDRLTFADVAGCDEAKEEVSEVVEFLKDPKKFTKMGGKIP